MTDNTPTDPFAGMDRVEILKELRAQTYYALSAAAVEGGSPGTVSQLVNTVTSLTVDIDNREREAEERAEDAAAEKAAFAAKQAVIPGAKTWAMGPFSTTITDSESAEVKASRDANPNQVADQVALMVATLSRIEHLLAAIHGVSIKHSYDISANNVEAAFRRGAK